jgi:hypothetical protein
VLNGECQENEDVKIKILITPGSLTHNIDIKYNLTEIKIRKHRSGEEPVDKKKSKHTRQIE